MKEYRFSIDRKVTMWERDHYVVKSKNKKEALEEMKRKVLEEDMHNADFIESENLVSTSVDLTIEENNGNPTLEILDEEKGVIVYKNTSNE